MVYYAALKGWVSMPTEAFRISLRGAYANGLALAVPVEPTVLGWAMTEHTP